MNMYKLTQISLETHQQDQKERQFLEKHIVYIY